jgi:hypothetical protein
MSLVPLCGYCLVQQDARVNVVAEFPDGSSELCASATNPARLRVWVEEAWAKGAKFAIADMPSAFRPVGTWHGDPVCVAHLWECVDRDRRRR